MLSIKFRWMPALVVFVLLMTANSTSAQETYSAIRGKVRDASGQEVAGAVVTIVDTRTGLARTFTSNSSGTFLAPRLPVGGPYEVSVAGQSPVEIPYIGVGDTYNLTLSTAGSGISEEVIVTGVAPVAVNTAPGPASTFSLADIESSVAFSRDIKEIYSLDPRLSLDDPSEGTALNCAGRHPRFNSVTLDGVGYNDRFGLNSNGYSTATGMPFPFESIENIAVELAPFDVTYGGFSACNINAVTKSGSSEWEGSVFYEFTNDGLRGDTIVLGGQDRDVSNDESYTERKFGFSAGGPVIEDKLYFFTAYEESEEPLFIGMGYAGYGGGRERSWLSEAEFDRINRIAQNIYDYDTGELPGNGVLEDKKFMARLDWNINADHELALVYNYYDGYEDRASDDDDSEFEFANHYYVKGAENTTYTLKLASQWTDALSTEFYYSYTEMIDSQVTVGNKEFADMQISVGGRTGTVYLGADDSRQANQLDTTSNFFKANLQYLLGDHVITAGFEMEKLEIFNQFVQHSRGGEYDYFDDSSDNPDYCAALTAQGRLDDPDCGTSGIDKFELGLPSRIYYGNGGGSNDPNDASALFSNTLNTLYLQDEIYFESIALTLIAGLRYEWFTSDDSPVYNPTFSAANGIRNDANIDDLDILMPRVGFTWEVSPEFVMRGGIGLFSGGNPNVWISNAWSNDGVTNVQLQRSFDESVFDLELTGAGRPGYDVPQSMVDEVLAVTPEDANDSFLALIDPDYEQPSELKIGLGGTYYFPGDYTLDVDFLTSRMSDSAYYVDLSQEVVGQTILGQPIYDYVLGEDNYMLTNSDEVAETSTLSFMLNKSFDFGLDLYFGYAYTDAEEITPMTSSVAGSNFTSTALLDINNPLPATSNYSVPHRFTMKLTYEKEFFDGYSTNFSLIGFSEEGQGQTYVMGSSALEGDGFNGRHLLYVPTGVNDPNVVFADDFDTDAFFAWAAAEGLGQGFVPRNGVNARWTTQFNFKVEQELPTFVDGTKGKVFLKIYNLGNLLNDDWGLYTDAVFYAPQVVDVSINDAGQYVYEEFTPATVNSVKDAFSVWEARLGVELRF